MSAEPMLYSNLGACIQVGRPKASKSPKAKDGKAKQGKSPKAKDGKSPKAKDAPSVRPLPN